MIEYIVAGIFILLCIIVAFWLANKRDYKDDSLKYEEKEVEHVLQQKLDIEKIKATPRKVSKHVATSSFNVGNIIGVVVGIIVLVAVAVPITTNVISVMNTTNAVNQSTIQLVVILPVLLIISLSLFVKF